LSTVEKTLYSGDRTEDQALVVEQLRHLWEDDLPLVSNLANVSALLKTYLNDTNWVGFYLWDSVRSELVLGPFQGWVACTRIALGKGVCGTAVATRQSQLVPDVHLFPGHIACDSASESEVVIPLISGDRILGVLDIDSPTKARFDETDLRFLETAAAVIVKNWS
jgi:GAF domain-containing protein